MYGGVLQVRCQANAGKEKRLKMSKKGFSVWLGILIVVSLIGFLDWVPSSEKFNPDMHDCTEWNFDYSCGNNTLQYHLQGRTFQGLNSLQITCRNFAVWNDESKCVSWQPKTPQLTKEEQQIVMETYCQNNPSDSQKCKCVEEEKRSRRVTDWLIYCTSRELNRSVNFTITSESFFIPFPGSAENWWCQMPQLQEIRELNETICVKAMPKENSCRKCWLSADGGKEWKDSVIRDCDVASSGKCAVVPLGHCNSETDLFAKCADFPNVTPPLQKVCLIPVIQECCAKASNAIEVR